MQVYRRDRLLFNEPPEELRDQPGSAVALGSRRPLLDELGSTCLECERAEVSGWRVPVQSAKDLERQPDHQGLVRRLPVRVDIVPIDVGDVPDHRLRNRDRLVIIPRG